MQVTIDPEGIMVGVDPGATQAAAATLSGAAADVAGARGSADCASASGVLSDAATREALDEVQTVVQLRLQDVAGELTALSEGMTRIADNVALATGAGT